MKLDVVYVETKLDKNGWSERYQRESVPRGIFLFMRLVALKESHNRLQSPTTPEDAIVIADSACRNDKSPSRHK